MVALACHSSEQNSLLQVALLESDLQTHTVSSLADCRPMVGSEVCLRHKQACRSVVMSAADLCLVVVLQGKSKLFGDILEEEHLLCPICMDRPLQVSVAECSHQVSLLSCNCYGGAGK